LQDWARTEQDFYDEASKLTEGFVERVRGGIWIYDSLRSLFLCAPVYRKSSNTSELDNTKNI